jgi:hypothetical protein
VACAPAVAPSLEFGRLVYALCCFSQTAILMSMERLQLMHDGVVAGGTSKMSES